MDIPLLIAILTVLIFTVAGIVSGYAWHRRNIVKMGGVKRKIHAERPTIMFNDEDEPSATVANVNESCSLNVENSRPVKLKVIKSLTSSSSESELDTSTTATTTTTTTHSSSAEKTPTFACLEQSKCSSCVTTKRLSPPDVDMNTNLDALTDTPHKIRKPYRKGDVLNDRYTVLRTIGKGKFGRVVCAVDSTDQKRVAVKILTSSENIDSAQAEVLLLKRLQHMDPDGKHLLVRMLAHFTFQQCLCIVFELLGPSLYDYLKKRNYQPYTLPQIRHIAYQLCHSISFLHERKIVHTDIKPENVVFVDRCKSELVNTCIKIIDFGTVVCEEDGFSGTIQTRHYRAPEVILRLGWSYPCDVWSLGCVLHETYTGQLLFPKTKKNVAHLAMMQVVLGSIPPVMHANSGREPYFVNGHLNICKEDMKQVESVCQPLVEAYKTDKQDQDLFALIRQMLTFEPEKRVACKVALEDPFFADLPESLRFL